MHLRILTAIVSLTLVVGCLLLYFWVPQLKDQALRANAVLLPEFILLINISDWFVKYFYLLLPLLVPLFFLSLSARKKS